MKRAMIANLFFRWDRAISPRSELAIIARFMESDGQAVRIGECQGRSSTSCLGFADGEMVFLEPVCPVLTGAHGNRQRDLHRQTGARFGGCHLGPRKKRNVRSGMTFAVRVKEVIGPR